MLLWLNGQPTHQDKMLAGDVSANHWYIHIGLCHRPSITLLFQEYVSYHIHITCLEPDFHAGGVEGKVGLLVTSVQDWDSTFLTRTTHVYHHILMWMLGKYPAKFVAAKTRYSWWNIRTSSAVFSDDQRSFPDLNKVVFVPEPNDHKHSNASKSLQLGTKQHVM